MSSSATSGFTAFKRTAAFSVNGSLLLDSQRITALPCVQPSAALCDQQKQRSTPALSLNPGAQAPASLPPVIFRRITSPDVPPGITSWRSQPCVRRCSFGALRLISAVTVSLSALVSAANLSTTLFLDGLCFPGASRTGLRSRLALKIFPAKRALRPGMIFASLASRHDICRHCVH